jgi:hypothetical protein
MEVQGKLAVIQKEKELDAMLLTTKLNLEAQLEQMRINGKIDMKQIEADSRAYVAEIKKSAEIDRQNRK